MHRTLIALVIVAAAARGAAAQASSELPLQAFLEKRVPEELAVEGHILSRQNLALEIDAAGTVLIVSLVDLDTGRVAASTKIDQVPADREAAVASVTHVAADLLSQLAGRPQVNGDVRAALDAERAARDADHQAAQAQELANLKLQKQMIRFGTTYDLVVGKNTATLVRNWVPYRGELDEELEPREFYELVGHPELADEYDARRKIAYGGLAVGAALFVGTTIFAIHGMVSGDNCDVTQDFNTFSACVDNESREHRNVVLESAGLALLSSVGFIVYGWYRFHPHPITEGEAKTMAGLYNDGLRHNLGLPVVKRHILREIRIAPYVAHDEGGLSLAARF